jgi:hypothetical protein
MLRILHVGLGPLGQRIVGDLHQRGLGEVVAAVDPASEFEGRTVGDLVRATGSRVAIAKSFRSIADAAPIDAAIVTTSSELVRCAPTFRELLQRGIAVVSTCEELCWPWLRHAALARELDLVAKQSGGRLLGTGVNPGFLMDAFPLAATAVSKSVRSLRVERHQDASSRRIPFQRKIGAGLDPRDFDAAVAAGTLRHVGLGESLHLLGERFGFVFERWTEEIHPILADRDLDSGLGPIPRGRLAGVRQEARGYVDGEARIVLDFRAAIGLRDPHDRVVVEGEPAIDLVWKGGVQGDVATSAIVLNAIRSLRASAPGLHTMASIPLVGWTPPARPASMPAGMSGARGGVPAAAPSA